jgi:hypothetical protein
MRPLCGSLGSEIDLLPKVGEPFGEFDEVGDAVGFNEVGTSAQGIGIQDI